MGLFEQLLAHVLGDYVLQTDRMARFKTASTPWAILHVLMYGLPFLVLGASWTALAVIVGTHFLIDRYRLALYVVKFKTVLDYSLRGPLAVRNRLDALDRFGFPQGTPEYLGFWFLILVDNTLHLTINYYALMYL
jgi:hypothetical protein